MHIAGFEWNEWNIRHISEHNVAPQEIEEACYNQPICRKTKDGLYLVYGQTDAGRYLFVVIRRKFNGLVYVITSRTMSEAERKYYRKRR